jgi:hypothetical protein
MTRGWKTAADVSPPPMRTGDERLWWYLSLYLMANRHCADFWSEEEQSIALHQVADNVEPPFDF